VGMDEMLCVLGEEAVRALLCHSFGPSRSTFVHGSESANTTLNFIQRRRHEIVYCLLCRQKYYFKQCKSTNEHANSILISNINNYHSS